MLLIPYVNSSETTQNDELLNTFNALENTFAKNKMPAGYVPGRGGSKGSVVGKDIQSLFWAAAKGNTPQLRKLLGALLPFFPPCVVSQAFHSECEYCDSCCVNSCLLVNQARRSAANPLTRTSAVITRPYTPRPPTDTPKPPVRPVYTCCWRPACCCAAAPAPALPLLCLTCLLPAAVPLTAVAGGSCCDS